MLSTRFVLLMILLVCPSVQAVDDLGWDGYHTADELRLALSDLVHGNGDRARLRQIGSSTEGRPIWAVELGFSEDKVAEERPALLVVAGLEGEHLLGTEACLALIRRALLASTDDSEAGPDFEDLLKDRTLYVIPRAHPDGGERMFARPLAALYGNARPEDEDRDGRADEDGPNDLDGDGFITFMRVKDPEGDQRIDEDEPRLMAKADRTKGERAEYKIYSEGIDSDGDGEINEDAAGGVILSRNFPFRYAMHEPNTGAHQVSELETRALADFFLAHRNIGAVLVFGLADNLIALPGKGKGGGGPPLDKGRGSTTRRGRGRSRKPVTSIPSADAPTFKRVAEAFQEIVETKGKAVAAEPGSFHEWVYFHQGVPGFSTRIWHREFPKKESEENAEEGEKKEEAEKEEKKKEKKEKKEEEKWLAYSDDVLEGRGFVNWSTYSHPTLGEVEIGGFVPGIRINPPADRAAELVKGPVEFVGRLLAMLPLLNVEASVEAKGGGIHEVRVRVTNDGEFPTALAHGVRTRQVSPVIVRLELESDDQEILAGERLGRISALEGSGGSQEFRWLIRGAKGSTVSVVVRASKAGTRTTEILL